MTDHDATARPVFLIGAARSGTKITRDALAVAMGVGAVPYDIGFVWRAGNQRHPDDCLVPGSVGSRERRFIRDYVLRYADGHPRTVIEKTVGNTLRVPFLEWVFPEATFIHLVRDGVDAVESTRRQWSAPADHRYLARKARHFPLRLAPSYGLEFLRSQLARRDRGHVGVWGVRYPDMQRDLEHEDLLTVCARQWRHSVQSASTALAGSSAQVIGVRYEELVSSPRATLERVVSELGHAADDGCLQSAANMVRGDAAGRGRLRLADVERALLVKEIGQVQEDLGYDTP